MHKIPTDEEIRYEIAAKKVKKIKGFYSHLAVYIIINTLLLIGNYQFWNKEGAFFSWDNLSTAFFWGIGLAAHGVSVFGFHLMFGKDWEERKIKELMEKDRKKNQNWE
jgi:hypothetical protein